jgi:23S rRNA pseudouridine1911/1915/1917 synthase
MPDWLSFEYAGTSGERADAAVAALLRARPGLADLSRTRVHDLIEQGGVQVNGDELLQPQKKLRPGMQVGVDLERLAQLLKPPESDMTPVDYPLHFHYVDERIAVVEKPAGLSVHPGAGEHGPTLAAALLHHFGQLSDEGGADRPGIVHRLDKETSGLVVIARDNLAHSALSRQFAERTTEKEYAALCLEAPDPPQGRVDLPIERHPKHRQLMWCGPVGTGLALSARNAVEPSADGRTLARPPAAGPVGSGRTPRGGSLQARTALTEYRVAEWWGPLALLDVAIHTGRTHQIRVHLQALRVSILGDEKYGEGRNRALRNYLKGRVAPQWQQAWRDAWPEPAQRAAMLEALTGYPGIFLHARRLALAHPATGERMEWTSPLPAAWERVRVLCE